MKRLTSQDSYQSPDRRAGWIPRCSPSAYFYAQIARIVFRASHLAKKGRYGDAQWVESSLATFRAVESVGGRLELEGLDVPRRLDSACVFIGNHMSVLETFLLPGLIQPHRDVTFVVKDSLVAYPLFGHVMRSRDPVVVGRDNPREDLRTVMEEGHRRLEAGRSIAIFPQTTRSVAFDPGRFNSLGVKLARRSGVPVVPFALKTDAWGLGRRLKDVGKIDPSKTVHICFGAPLRVQGAGKAEHQFIVEFIAGKLRAWQQPAGLKLPDA
jgi:1-acyl-sn-glycerol-3-phosphate acyltransferase